MLTHGKEKRCGQADITAVGGQHFRRTARKKRSERRERERKEESEGRRKISFGLHYT